MSRAWRVPPASDAVRHPVAAGSFYPADPATLAAAVDGLVGAIEVPAGEPLAPAYVVPHAGYRYSGSTAAHVYARLLVHAAGIDRVVLFGPAHKVPLQGCAVPSTDRWLTPLGEVVIDPITRGLAADGHASADDTPHAPEHSLEVQLPFLQRVVPRATVVPVVVGQSTWDDVVLTVAAVAAEPRTVTLCSTDLSHYLPDEEARRQDARTAAAIEALAPDRIGVRDACGVFALRGIVAWARHAGLRPRRLALTTSAESPAGNPDRVVGYAAFALDGARASTTGTMTGWWNGSS
jgi:AmmeMemoRadiSam system protein B